MITLLIASTLLRASAQKSPYVPSLQSLTRYKCPTWFRDAKFGIWAHWGPQSVPGQGDWYARRLYEQGDSGYAYHVAHYGHPSKFGYKDVIPLWRAEKWDPDRLMALYKKAGARYFVSMGVHHDNFDLWNSKFHRWNAVNMGPKRDVVGTWQRSAKRLGLKFGVSEHLGASFTWFQDSHGSDKSGPLTGVPYDGADPANWDLYHFPAEPDDRGWYSNNPKWQQEWSQRITDLVDSYHPDLLYSDGGVPFGNEVGLSMIAHLYNSDPGRKGLQSQVVYTCKQHSDGRWVEDLERGVMKGINPYPWQTDTSIGDWFYNVNWKFRDVNWVVHMLIDDVSKNGNLLLNVVQHPDGSIDPEVETLLAQLAAWTSVNGEGIYGSRPWVTYGEGKTRARGGNFAEDSSYSADDIRFTANKGAVYAFALGWPQDGRLLIRTLAKTPYSGVVSSVKLLGFKGQVKWSQTADGLAVELPDRRVSDVAICLKLTGERMDLFKAPEEPISRVSEDPAGNFLLMAGHAILNGSGIQAEKQGGHDDIGYWDSPKDFVSWRIVAKSAGRFKVLLQSASPNEGVSLRCECGSQTLVIPIPKTAGFADFVAVEAGFIEIPAAGEYTISFKPADEASWKPMNLAEILLARHP